MPPVTVSWWLPLYHVGDIVKLSLLICLIDICESVSIAKSLAQVSVPPQAAAAAPARR
jgi:sulfate transporter 4